MATLSSASHLILAVVLFSLAPHCRGGEALLHAPQAVRDDLYFALAEIARIHPEPGVSVDPAQLKRAVEAAETSLHRPLRRTDAWAILARLNPVLADGHLMIGFPDWRADSAAHLEAGGSLFPFEVFLDAQGVPRIRRLLGGGLASHPGAKILRINGRDALAVSTSMLARVHGDTEAFRRHLLGQRWWFYYWKLFGAPDRFTIELGSGARLQLPAARAVPELLRDEGDFSRQFHFQLLPDKAAYLKLGTFAWPDRERYLAFTRDVFAQVRKAGVRTLLVDIRSNGGGNDDMWIDGVMRYVAGTPFRWASSYSKRVLAGRAVEAGQQVGDVVRGEINRWIEPALDDPSRFQGRLYVLVGGGTYSSAILFANAVQDFNVGTVVGVGNMTRARQSGGTQNVILPNTGLVVSSPRLLLTRPSGSEAPVLFAPDLELDDDPLDSEGMVNAVLRIDRKRMAGESADSP